VVLGALTWYYVMDYYYATNHADPREVTRWSKMLERRLMCQQMWIGDSALDIRTKYPMYLHLDRYPVEEFTHPDDFDQMMWITVSMGEDEEYDPNEYERAPYAIVTLSQGFRQLDHNWSWNEYYSGIADENGAVEIPALYAVEKGLLRIVATRHNCRPALYWIDLTE